MLTMRPVQALKSEVVAQEFQALVTQHRALIKMGGGYGKWDREGKKMYIQQMEDVRHPRSTHFALTFLAPNPYLLVVPRVT